MNELESQSLALGSWGVAVWDCNHGTERVVVWNCNYERDRVGNCCLKLYKRLLSEIVTVKEIGLEIIFFLLGFLNLEKLFLNYRTNSGKNVIMTWLQM